MRKAFDVRRLDVKAFAGEGAQLEGRDALSAHSRLLAETQGRTPDAMISWAARGELRNPAHVQPQVWLHLDAQATLSLVCQRCLAPVDIPVVVDRSFRFVTDEQTAAAEDEQSEEDLLALTTEFDLMELIEDELLMELPVAPRHSACPVPVTMTVADAGVSAQVEPAESPFALLRKLTSRP
jgi:uncharacterized protein